MQHATARAQPEARHEKAPPPGFGSRNLDYLLFPSVKASGLSGPDAKGARITSEDRLNSCQPQGASQEFCKELHRFPPREELRHVHAPGVKSMPACAQALPSSQEGSRRCQSF